MGRNFRISIKADLPSVHPLRAELQRMSYEVQLDSDSLRIRQNRWVGFSMNGWAALLMGNVLVSHQGQSLLLTFNISSFLPFLWVGLGTLGVSALFMAKSPESHLQSIMASVGFGLVVGVIVALGTVISTVRRDVRNAVKAVK